MDNLTKDAMLARQAGMTYGKWKAMQPVEKPAPKKIPDGWKCCEYCGKLFKGVVNKRFCEPYCRIVSYNERMRKEGIVHG